MDILKSFNLGTHDELLFQANQIGKLLEMENYFIRIKFELIFILCKININAS